MTRNWHGSAVALRQKPALRQRQGVQLASSCRHRMPRWLCMRLALPLGRQSILDQVRQELTDRPAILGCGSTDGFGQLRLRAETQMGLRHRLSSLLQLRCGQHHAWTSEPQRTDMHGGLGGTVRELRGKIFQGPNNFGRGVWEPASCRRANSNFTPPSSFGRFKGWSGDSPADLARACDRACAWNAGPELDLDFQSRAKALSTA